MLDRRRVLRGAAAFGAGALSAPAILRYAIAHDCGQAINPLLVKGQLQGGVVHGVGYALMEQVVY